MDASGQPDDAAGHVFDQTNGMIAAPDADPAESLSDSERDRRRRDSSALAYGLYGTAHS